MNTDLIRVHPRKSGAEKKSLSFRASSSPLFRNPLQTSIPNG
jgi:hypothetical protein